MTPDWLQNSVLGIAGSAVGGGAAAWVVRMLLTRLIKDYDRRIEALSQKSEMILEKVQDYRSRLAVLEAVLEDARRLRIDLEQRFASLRGEGETRIASVNEEIDNLRRDIFVAHERLRAMASGDNEISKITAPPIIRRR